MQSNKIFRNKRLAPRAYWREVLAVLMILLAIIFFRSERKELSAIVPQLQQANIVWVLIGLAVTIIHFIFQGGMYRECFAAIKLKFSWPDAIILFLKRNLLSVFLPAGGVSSLAYSPSQVRKAGFAQSQVHQASAMYGFAGLLTLAIAAVPIVGITVSHGNGFNDAWLALSILIATILLLFTAARSIQQKGWLYQMITKKFRSTATILDSLFAANISRRKFGAALLHSGGVELTGMVHIYIAMVALSAHGSIEAAATAYIISVLLMVISPFLRGLGAVELSMVYVLQRFGYNPGLAVAITILYRVFEFWIPLLAGLLVYVWKGRKLFLRLAPAMLTFFLGIVNIVSAVTAPLRHRVTVLHEYIPFSAIHASNTMVLFAGLALIVTAAFLFRGLRAAWIFALLLAAFSLAGHLTKALDYEEAIFAGVTIAALLLTGSQYYVRGSSKWAKAGIKTALLSFFAVLIFGFISFYFIDRKHFGIDFTWRQSLLHTFNIFLLVQDDNLQPVTRFGHEFVNIVRTLGFLTWAFLFYTLLRPRFVHHSYDESFRDRAVFLISQYGNSATDYFKVYKDKLYFFSEVCDGFIAYRVSSALPLFWKNQCVRKRTK